MCSKVLFSLSTDSLLPYLHIFLLIPFFSTTNPIINSSAPLDVYAILGLDLIILINFNSEHYRVFSWDIAKTKRDINVSISQQIKSILVEM
jgi:hypothetical protein